VNLISDNLVDEVKKINWFHTIDLRHGIITAGRDDSPTKLAKLQMPSDGFLPYQRIE